MKFLKVFALAFAALLPVAAFAQVVTSLPVAVSGATPTDLGNGPLELRLVQGNMLLFTSQGGGLGSTSGSATLLTLSATAAADPPCVGCIISGAGITSGTTVTAFNGTTSVTLSAAMTVAGATPVAWGMACPTSVAGVPVTPVRAAVGGDWPMYTQSRVCVGAGSGPGAALLPFAIGAH